MTGQCVEIPSEPDERHNALCAKVKLTNYPLVKLGDVLWTYMGDPKDMPELPEWEFARVPAGQSYTSKRWQECNWLQALEGGIDSSHVSWLHSDGLRSDPLVAAVTRRNPRRPRHGSAFNRPNAAARDARDMPEILTALQV